MNVSKEVKDKFTGLVDSVRSAMSDVAGSTLFNVNDKWDSLSTLWLEAEEFAASLTITEPAAPKHEWKVGDCFRFDDACVRQIIAISEGFGAINEYSEQTAYEGKTIHELMDLSGYRHAVPVTLDEWFAAVRKAHEVNK